MCCSFRGRRSTLDVSIVIFRGRRSTLDVLCCEFFVQIALAVLRQVATRCKFRGSRGILCGVLKIDGSLARNIDFEVANFQVLRKTRRKTSILKLQSVKIGGSLARNARPLASLVFPWPRRVYGGSCKTCPFVMLPPVKIGGSLVRNAVFSASTCLVASLSFSCGVAASARLVSSRWSSCGIAVSIGEAPHSTLYTLHSALHNLHFRLHTGHSTLYTPHFTLCTLPSSLLTRDFTLHTPHFTLHTPHSTLYTPHF